MKIIFILSPILIIIYYVVQIKFTLSHKLNKKLIIIYIFECLTLLCIAFTIKDILNKLF
jgi:hypothetical protein